MAEGLSPEKIRESSVAEQSARSFLQDTIVPLSNAVVLRRVVDVPFVLGTVLFESRSEDLAGVFATAIALKCLHSLVELCFCPCRKVIIRCTSSILLRKEVEAHVARRIIDEEDIVPSLAKRLDGERSADVSVDMFGELCSSVATSDLANGLAGFLGEDARLAEGRRGVVGEDEACDETVAHQLGRGSG